MIAHCYQPGCGLGVPHSHQPADTTPATSSASVIVRDPPVFNGWCRCCRVPASDCENRKRISALTAQLDEAKKLLTAQADWHSFCCECGPNVRVDEDALCVSCGATSTGWALDAHRETIRAFLEKP